MKIKLLFALSIVLLLSSCRKKDIGDLIDQVNLAPKEFTVSVLTREQTFAVLEWTEAIDFDGDKVSYSVELDGKTLISNLSSLTYRIPGIQPALSYKGKVTAVDARGKKTSIDFEIIPFQGQLIMSLGFYGGIESYDAAGKLSWKLGEALRNTPAVSNDTLFFGDLSDVYAASLQNGKTIWKTPIRQTSETVTIYYQGKLFFVSSGKIYSLNTKDGTVIWTADIKVSRSLVVSKGVLFATDNTTLTAIDVKTGSVKWSFKQIGLTNSAPAAKDGVVYLISGINPDKPSYLSALDAQSGALKWKYTFNGIALNFAECGSPTIYGSTIYFPVTTGYSPMIQSMCAVNTNDGTLVWQKVLENNSSNVKGVVADAGGVYTLSDTYLFKLNRQTGQKTWSQYGNFTTNFTLADDKLYVNVNPVANMVTTFDTASGVKLKEIVGRFGFVSSPVVVKNGTAFYPAHTGMNAGN